MPHVIYNVHGRELIRAEHVGAIVGLRVGGQPEREAARIAPHDARELARALVALADEADENP